MLPALLLCLLMLSWPAAAGGSLYLLLVSGGNPGPAVTRFFKQL